MSKALLVVTAIVALGACGQDSPKGKATPPKVVDAGAKPPLFGDPVKPDAIPRDATGAQLYGTLCALCHGAEAKGYNADNAPSLRSETFLASASDEFLAHAIRDGRPGSSMAAYARARGGPLLDEEIAKIIGWIREGGPAPVALEAKASKGDPAKGQATWDKTCKACHGDPQTHGIAVHLSSATFLATATDEFLRYAIVQGRPGTQMLPMGGAQLTAADIEDVIALIRSWQTAEPVKPDQEIKAPEPKDTQIVLNPKGKNPTFTVKDERFVAAKEIADALAAGKRLVIIDARPPSEWYGLRMKGAISVPYYQPELLDQLPEELKKDTWVFAYCACPHHLSGVVVDELQKRGFAHAAVIDEGINFWAQQGYPTEGTQPAPEPAKTEKVKTP